MGTSLQADEHSNGGEVGRSVTVERVDLRQPIGGRRWVALLVRFDTVGHYRFTEVVQNSLLRRQIHALEPSSPGTILSARPGSDA